MQQLQGVVHHVHGIAKCGQVRQRKRSWPVGMWATPGGGQRNQEGDGQRDAQAWRIGRQLQRPTAATWICWRLRCAAQRSESSLPGLQASLEQAMWAGAGRSPGRAEKHRLQGRLRRPQGCPRPCGVGSAHGQEIGRDVRGLAVARSKGAKARGSSCRGELVQAEILRVMSVTLLRAQIQGRE